MMREPESAENLTLNIVFKDGTTVNGADTTGNPFGQHERVVAYWHEGVVCVVPMTEVEVVQMCFGGVDAQSNE